MFTWTYSETVNTNATSDQVWSILKNVQDWPSWDKELEWARLDGPFQVGTKGQLKPSKGPEVAFELIDVMPGYSFSNKAKLPLTKMIFFHEYLPQDSHNEARICHRVVMSGLLAPLFGKIIGSQIKLHLREAMETLSEKALRTQVTQK